MWDEVLLPPTHRTMRLRDEWAQNALFRVGAGNEICGLIPGPNRGTWGTQIGS
jgi:hypothetical protein